MKFLEVKYSAIVAQYISYVLVLAISFLISIYLARKLGPEVFGIYSTALSVGSILLILYDFGYRNLILRETSKASKKFTSYRCSLFWLSFRHSVIVGVVFIVSGGLIFPEQIHLILALSLCFFGVHITQIISSSLKGGEKYLEDGLHVFSARVISALFIISMFFVQRLTVENIFYAWGAGLLAYSFFSWRSLFKPCEGPPFTYIYSTLFPLFLIDMFLVLYLRSDIIFMQALGVNKSQVGNYSAAIRIIEACLLITVPMRAILQVEMRKKKFEEPQSIINLIVKLIFSLIVGTALAFIISINSIDIIKLVYGNEYNRAAIYLGKLAWFLVPAMVLVIVNEAIIAMELEKWQSILLAVIAISMVIGLYYVVTLFGADGVLYIKVGGESLLAISTTVLVLAFCIQNLRNGRA